MRSAGRPRSSRSAVAGGGVGAASTGAGAGGVGAGASDDAAGGGQGATGAAGDGGRDGDEHDHEHRAITRASLRIREASATLTARRKWPAPEGPCSDQGWVAASYASGTASPIAVLLLITANATVPSGKMYDLLLNWALPAGRSPPLVR